MRDHDERPSVLIIEDDPVAAEMLVLTLGAARYRIVYAADASSALFSLEDRTPDVVLLDCRLGNGGLYEILAAADLHNAALVLISDRADLHSQFAAFGYLCLRVPLNQIGILDAIDVALRSKR